MHEKRAAARGEKDAGASAKKALSSLRETS